MAFPHSDLSHMGQMLNNSSGVQGDETLSVTPLGQAGRDGLTVYPASPGTRLPPRPLRL